VDDPPPVAGAHICRVPRAMPMKCIAIARRCATNSVDSADIRFAAGIAKE
jgi:hypothetical protein